MTQGNDESRPPVFPQWSIHLPEPMRETIDALRQQEGVSRAEMVRRILEVGLKHFGRKVA